MWIMELEMRVDQLWGIYIHKNLSCHYVVNLAMLLALTQFEHSKQQKKLLKTGRFQGFFHRFGKMTYAPGTWNFSGILL